MNRRLLLIDSESKKWRVENLQVENLKKDPREDYLLLCGESLCQYQLRRNKKSFVIARGALPFVTGNKTTVGYISPQTGLPHYSYVGGNAHEQLLKSGLDAICVMYNEKIDAVADHYVVVKGCAPNLTVEFKPNGDLPTGQRSSYYWLVENELDGNKQRGSVFTLGEAAYFGYKSANLATEAFFHAGRGGIGGLFAKFASAMVLSGRYHPELKDIQGADVKEINRIFNEEYTPRLKKYCHRLSSKTGGTIIKLYATGGNPPGKNTLPAKNGQELGCQMASIGAPAILKATREGQTGCKWCEVKCRHWHTIEADYAPDNKDIFLDDFEPAYSIFAMLKLESKDDSTKAKIALLKDVDKRIIKVIEQMGLDIMDIGMGFAALYEAVEKKLLPNKDYPEFMNDGECFNNVDLTAKLVTMLRTREAEKYPALTAAASGPQVMADIYTELKDIVFTGGKQTIGNAGHCNALWTFLMPLGRFFSHYAGQFYKIDEKLPDPGSSDEEYKIIFKRAIRQLLDKEFYCLLGNVLSHCGFTFVAFSEGGKNKQLCKEDLLVRLIQAYGYQINKPDLVWFGQAFWAQSILFKLECGWEIPTADDFPDRIYESLAIKLKHSPEELKKLMGILIDEWRTQATDILYHMGYDKNLEREII